MSQTGSSLMRGTRQRRKKILTAIAIISICGLLVMWVMRGYAANEEKSSVKTQKGLRFIVPEDWPIEERNGVVAPIPIEEYITKRFKNIEAKLSYISGVLEDVKSGLGDRKVESPNVSEEAKSKIQKMETDTAKQFEGIKSGMGSLTNSVGNLKSDLEKVDSRITYIDKGVPDKIASFEKKLDELEKKIRNLEFYVDSMLEEERTIKP